MPCPFKSWIPSSKQVLTALPLFPGNEIWLQSWRFISPNLFCINSEGVFFVVVFYYFILSYSPAISSSHNQAAIFPLRVSFISPHFSLILGWLPALPLNPAIFPPPPPPIPSSPTFYTHTQLASGIDSFQFLSKGLYCFLSTWNCFLSLTITVLFSIFN